MGGPPKTSVRFGVDTFKTNGLGELLHDNEVFAKLMPACNLCCASGSDIG